MRSRNDRDHLSPGRRAAPPSPRTAIRARQRHGRRRRARRHALAAPSTRGRRPVRPRAPALSAPPMLPRIVVTKPSVSRMRNASRNDGGDTPKSSINCSCGGSIAPSISWPDRTWSRRLSATMSATSRPPRLALFRTRALLPTKLLCLGRLSEPRLVEEHDAVDRLCRAPARSWPRAMSWIAGAERQERHIGGVVLVAIVSSAFFLSASLVARGPALSAASTSGFE